MAKQHGHESDNDPAYDSGRKISPRQLTAGRMPRNAAKRKGFGERPKG